MNMRKQISDGRVCENVILKVDLKMNKFVCP